MKILFLCGHNAGRSQMAEALFNRFKRSQNIMAISAGIDPSKEINQTAKNLLRSDGIETKTLHPKKLIKEMAQDIEQVYTMGCNVDCSKIDFPLQITEDWDLEDPHGKSPEETKLIYNQLKKKVEELLKSLEKSQSETIP